MHSFEKIKPKKILIIKLKKLGDVLTTTPITRQLRNLYPNAEIVFLAEPLGAQVYEQSVNINDVWILNRKPSVLEYIKLCFKVYKANFDVVIDLYDHNKTALLTLLSSAKYRLGFAKIGKKSFAYNYVLRLTDNEKTSLYSTLHLLKLTAILGTNMFDFNLEFTVSPPNEQFGATFSNQHKFLNKTIAFCAQSERKFAQVPLELFIKTGNYLIEQGYQLYFVYGPGEKKEALKVYNKIINKSACIIEYEMPTIAQLKAILGHCAIYIGNDSGNKHIAVAANICSIGMFYGDNPAVWTPPKNKKHRFLQTQNNETAFNDFVNLFETWSYSKKQFIND